MLNMISFSSYDPTFMNRERCLNSQVQLMLDSCQKLDATEHLRKQAKKKWTGMEIR
jgi:hypothetical protein